MFETPDWPYFLGAPQAEGDIRSTPEDFFVEEIPRVQPDGEGSHLWLWVEKRSANTDWVARELAKAVNCSPRDVGFAGLKDRHAVTRQWFSVPATPSISKELEKIDIKGVEILASHKHSRKLKRGTLKGNRFHLKNVEKTQVSCKSSQPIEMHHCYPRQPRPPTCSFPVSSSCPSSTPSSVVAFAFCDRRTRRTT